MTSTNPAATSAPTTDAPTTDAPTTDVPTLHAAAATAFDRPGPSHPRHGVIRGRSARALGLGVALALLGFVVLLSIGVGAKPIALGRVLDALVRYDRTDTDHLIVHTVRLPRTAVGVLVGVALGLAGAVMQGVARNPLADPGILGVNAGAALFVSVGISAFGLDSLSGYLWFAFAGAGVTSMAVYGLAATGREGATPVKLALAGAAVGILCLSLTRAVLLVDAATLDQFRFWNVGSLGGRRGEIAWSVLPFVGVGSVLAIGLAQRLNGLALGDDVARSLGQRVGWTRALAALAVVLLCGSATAAAGPIAFVGLTVPHIARAIAGPDYRWVLPYSAVLAPVLLLGSDILGRVVARPGEIEVGVVTAFVGAPFFIALVRRRRPAEL